MRLKWMIPGHSRGILPALAAGLGALLPLLLAGCDLVRTQHTAAPAPLNTPTEQQQQAVADAMEEKEQGNYDTALSMFQEILAKNPTVTTAYLGIGDIYIIKKDYAKAEPAFGKAARLEPRNFDAQYGHGLALQMLKRFVDAVRLPPRPHDRSGQRQGQPEHGNYVPGDG